MSLENTFKRVSNLKYKQNMEVSIMNMEIKIQSGKWVVVAQGVFTDEAGKTFKGTRNLGVFMTKAEAQAFVDDQSTAPKEKEDTTPAPEEKTAQNRNKGSKKKNDQVDILDD